jgi:branched-chain amino acid transport system substrate-binding protein
MLRFAFGAAVAAIGALAALAPAQAADKDIVFGFAVGQSGWMSQFDGPPVQGALMAIDDFNAKGGILGRKLKAIFADTKSDQTEGAKAGQTVIANGADFMIVSCDYDMGAGAATVANDHKMVVFSLCASDAKMGVQGIGPYAFSIANASVTIGATMAQFAYENKGWHSAYLLVDTSTEYSKGICAGFKTRWQQMGGTLTGEDTFKQDDASIASQVTRMQQVTSKTDFIMLCSYGGGATSSIRQIRAAGLNTPMGGADSMDGDYWTAGIPHLNDHYASTLGSPFGDDPRPHFNQIMDALAKANGGKRLPESLAVSGYSVIEAFALAITRAGSIDSDKVLAELNKFKNEELAVGPVTYTPELHINLTRPQAILGIKDGKGSFVAMVQLPEPPPLQLIFKN